MAQCRDLENHHHEKLLEIAINTLEKIVKSEYDEEMPDDVRMVSFSYPSPNSPGTKRGGMLLFWISH